MPMATPT